MSSLLLVMKKMVMNVVEKEEKKNSENSTLFIWLIESFLMIAPFYLLHTHKFFSNNVRLSVNYTSFV